MELTLEAFGLLFLIVFGTCAHFIYEWSGHNKLAGVICAVNESTWEHMKLVIGPSLIWMIVEAPFLNIPVINIGDRQKGRSLCPNVLQCNTDIHSMENAFSQVREYHQDADDKRLQYWGDGHTGQKVLAILKDIVK